MKLRTVLAIVLSIAFAFSLMTAYAQDKAVSEKSDKKTECTMKAGSKECTEKGDASGKDCCMKDGKASGKVKTSMKGDKSKCPGMKSTEKTGKEKK